MRLEKDIRNLTELYLKESNNSSFEAKRITCFIMHRKTYQIIHFKEKFIDYYKIFLIEIKWDFLSSHINFDGMWNLSNLYATCNI